MEICYSPVTGVRLQIPGMSDYIKIEDGVSIEGGNAPLSAGATFTITIANPTSFKYVPHVFAGGCKFSIEEVVSSGPDFGCAKLELGSKNNWDTQELSALFTDEAESFVILSKVVTSVGNLTIQYRSTGTSGRYEDGILAVNIGEIGPGYNATIQGENLMMYRIDMKPTIMAGAGDRKLYFFEDGEYKYLRDLYVSDMREFKIKKAFVNTKIERGQYLEDYATKYKIYLGYKGTNYGKDMVKFSSTIDFKISGSTSGFENCLAYYGSSYNIPNGSSNATHYTEGGHNNRTVSIASVDMFDDVVVAQGNHDDIGCCRRTNIYGDCDVNCGLSMVVTPRYNSLDVNISSGILLFKHGPKNGGCSFREGNQFYCNTLELTAYPFEPFFFISDTSTVLFQATPSHQIPWNSFSEPKVEVHTAFDDEGTYYVVGENIEIWVTFKMKINRFDSKVYPGTALFKVCHQRDTGCDGQWEKGSSKYKYLPMFWTDNNDRCTTMQSNIYDALDMTADNKYIIYPIDFTPEYKPLQPFTIRTRLASPKCAESRLPDNGCLYVSVLLKDLDKLQSNGYSILSKVSPKLVIGPLDTCKSLIKDFEVSIDCGNGVHENVYAGRKILENGGFSSDVEDYHYNDGKLHFYYQLDISEIVTALGEQKEEGESINSNKFCYLKVFVVADATNTVVDKGNSARSPEINAKVLYDPKVNVTYIRTEIDHRVVNGFSQSLTNLTFAMENMIENETIESVSWGGVARTPIGNVLTGQFIRFDEYITATIHYPQIDGRGKLQRVANDLTTIRNVEFKPEIEESKTYLGVLVTRGASCPPGDKACFLAYVKFESGGTLSSCDSDSANHYKCKFLEYPQDWKGNIFFISRGTTHIFNIPKPNYSMVLPPIKTIKYETYETDGLEDGNPSFYIPPEKEFELNLTLLFGTMSFPRELTYSYSIGCEEEPIQGTLTGSLNSSSNIFVVTKTTILGLTKSPLSQFATTVPVYFTITNVYTADVPLLKFQVSVTRETPKCNLTFKYGDNMVQQCLFVSNSPEDIYNHIRGGVVAKETNILDQIVMENEKTNLVVTGIDIKKEEIGSISVTITPKNGAPITRDAVLTEQDFHVVNKEKWACKIRLDELYSKMKTNEVYDVVVVVKSLNGFSSGELTTKILYLGELKPTYKRISIEKGAASDGPNPTNILEMKLPEEPAGSFVSGVCTDSESNYEEVDSFNRTKSLSWNFKKCFAKIGFSGINGEKQYEASDETEFLDIVKYSSVFDDVSQKSILNIDIKTNNSKTTDTPVPKIRFSTNIATEIACKIAPDPNTNTIQCTDFNFPTDWKGDVWISYSGTTIHHVINKTDLNGILPPIESVTMEKQDGREVIEGGKVFYVGLEDKLDIMLSFKDKTKTSCYAEALSYNYATYTLGEDGELPPNSESTSVTDKFNLNSFNSKPGASFQILRDNISELVAGATTNRVYKFTINNVYTSSKDTFLFFIKVTKERVTCGNKINGVEGGADESVCIMMIQDGSPWDKHRERLLNPIQDRDDSIYSQVYRFNQASISTDPIRLAVAGINYRHYEINKISYKFDIRKVSDEDRPISDLETAQGSLEMDPGSLIEPRKWIAYQTVTDILLAMEDDQIGVFTIDFNTYANVTSTPLTLKVKKDFDISFNHIFAFTDFVKKTKYINVIANFKPVDIPKYHFELHRFVCEGNTKSSEPGGSLEKVFDGTIAEGNNCDMADQVTIKYKYSGLRGILARKSENKTEIINFELSARLRDSNIYNLVVTPICHANFPNCQTGTNKIMFDEGGGRDFKELGYKIDDAATSCELKDGVVQCNSVYINYKWVNTVTFGPKSTLIRKEIVAGDINNVIPNILTLSLNKIPTSITSSSTPNPPVGKVPVGESSPFNFEIGFSKITEQTVRSLMLEFWITESGLLKKDAEFEVLVRLVSNRSSFATGTVALTNYLVEKKKLRAKVCNTGTEGALHQCNENVFLFDISVELVIPKIIGKYCGLSDFPGISLMGIDYTDYCESKPVFPQTTEGIKFGFGPIEFGETQFESLSVKLKAKGSNDFIGDWTKISSSEFEQKGAPIDEIVLGNTFIFTITAFGDIALKPGVIYIVSVKASSTSGLESLEISGEFVLRPDLYVTYKYTSIEYKDGKSFMTLGNYAIINNQGLEIPPNSEVDKVKCSGEEVMTDASLETHITCPSTEIEFGVTLGGLSQLIFYDGVSFDPVFEFSASPKANKLLVKLFCRSPVGIEKCATGGELLVFNGDSPIENVLKLIDSNTLEGEKMVMSSDWDGKISLITKSSLIISRIVETYNFVSFVPPIKSVSINGWETEGKEIYLTHNSFKLESHLLTSTTSFIDKLEMEILKRDNNSVISGWGQESRSCCTTPTDIVSLVVTLDSFSQFDLSTTSKYILKIKNTPTYLYKPAGSTTKNLESFFINFSFVSESDRNKQFVSDVIHLNYLQQQDYPQTTSTETRLFFKDETIKCVIGPYNPQSIPVYKYNISVFVAGGDVNDPIIKEEFLLDVYPLEQREVEPFEFQIETKNLKVSGDFIMRVTTTPADLVPVVNDIPFSVIEFNKLPYHHTFLNTQKMSENAVYLQLQPNNPLELRVTSTPELVANKEGGQFEIEEDTKIKLRINSLQQVTDFSVFFKVALDSISPPGKFYERTMMGELEKGFIGAEVLVEPVEDCRSIVVKPVCRSPCGGGQITKALYKFDENSEFFNCRILKTDNKAVCEGGRPESDWSGFIVLQLNEVLAIETSIDFTKAKDTFAFIESIGVGGETTKLTFGENNKIANVDLQLTQCYSGSPTHIRYEFSNNKTNIISGQFQITRDEKNKKHATLNNFDFSGGLGAEGGEKISFSNFDPSWVDSRTLVLFLNAEKVECESGGSNVCVFFWNGSETELADATKNSTTLPPNDPRGDIGVNNMSGVKLGGVFKVTGHIKSILLTTAPGKSCSVTPPAKNFTDEKFVFVSDDKGTGCSDFHKKMFDMSGTANVKIIMTLGSGDMPEYSVTLYKYSKPPVRKEDINIKFSGCNGSNCTEAKTLFTDKLEESLILNLNNKFDYTERIKVEFVFQEFDASTGFAEEKEITNYTLAPTSISLSTKCNGDGRINVILTPENSFFGANEDEAAKDLFVFIDTRGSPTIPSLHFVRDVGTTPQVVEPPLPPQNYYQVQLNDLIEAAGATGLLRLDVSVSDGPNNKPLGSATKEYKTKEEKHNRNTDTFNITIRPPRANTAKLWFTVTILNDFNKSASSTIVVDLTQPNLKELKFPVEDGEVLSTNNDLLEHKLNELCKSGGSKKGECRLRLYDSEWNPVVSVQNSTKNNKLEEETQMGSSFNLNELINLLGEKGIGNYIVVATVTLEKGKLYEYALSINLIECPGDGDSGKEYIIKNGECVPCNMLQKRANPEKCELDLNIITISVLCAAFLAGLAIILVPVLVVRWYKKNHKYNISVKAEAKERRELEKELELRRQEEAMGSEVSDDNGEGSQVYVINQYVSESGGCESDPSKLRFYQNYVNGVGPYSSELKNPNATTCNGLLHPDMGINEYFSSMSYSGSNFSISHDIYSGCDGQYGSVIYPSFNGPNSYDDYGTTQVTFDQTGNEQYSTDGKQLR